MKYIDTDKLKERVTRLIASARQNDWPIAEDYLRRVIDTIDSLQQEQPETTSIKGYLSRDIGGQLIISLSPNYMDDEWMLLESKLFPEIKSGNAPCCVNIIIKDIE